MGIGAWWGVLLEETIGIKCKIGDGLQINKVVENIWSGKCG